MRVAFKMAINKGCAEEYQKRHNPIWQELEQTLLSHGVLNYSIYLDDESGTLFAYAEVESEELWQQIADTDICQKWWMHMAPLMLTNSDNSPKSTALREVFHIDRGDEH